MVKRLDILWNNANKNLLSKTTQNEFKEKIRKFLKGESSQSDFVSELKLSKEILEDDIEDGKQPDESFNLFKKTVKQLIDEVLDDSAEPYLKIEADAWKNLTNKKKRKFNKREIQDGINEKNLEFVRGITLSNIAKDDDVIERLTGTLQLEDLSGIEDEFAQSNEANQFIGPNFGYDYYMEMNAKIRKPMRPEEPYFLTYAIGNNENLKESHVDIYWPVLDINEQIELRAKYVADRLGIPALPTIKKGKQFVGQVRVSDFKIPLDKKIIKEMSKKLEPLEEKHGNTFQIVSPRSAGLKGMSVEEQIKVSRLVGGGAKQFDRKDHINPKVHKSAEEAVREVLKTIVGKGYDEPLKQLDAIYQYVISLKLFDTERADKDLVQRVAETYPTDADGKVMLPVDIEELSEEEKKKLNKPKYPNREYKADFYSIPNWYVLKENTNEIEGVKSTRGYLNADNPNAEIYYVEDKKTYEDNEELFDEAWERMKQEAIKKYSNKDFTIDTIPDVYRRVFIQRERRKLTPQEAKGLENYKLLTEKYDETTGSKYTFISKEAREKKDLAGGKYGIGLSDKDRILNYIRILGNSGELNERATERLGLLDELLNDSAAFTTIEETNLIFPVDYEIDESIPKERRVLPIEKADKPRIKIGEWLNLLRGDMMLSFEEKKLNLEESSQYYLVKDIIAGEVVGTKTTRTKEQVEGDKGRMEQETVNALANEFKKGLKGVAKIQLHTLAEIEYNPSKTRGVNKAMKNHINTILNKVQDILDEVEE